MRTLPSSNACLTVGLPVRDRPWQSSFHGSEPIPRLPFALDGQIYVVRRPLQVDSWNKQGGSEGEGRKGSRESGRKV